MVHFKPLQQSVSINNIGFKPSSLSNNILVGNIIKQYFIPTFDMVGFTAVIGAKAFEITKKVFKSTAKILGNSDLFQVSMFVGVDEMRKIVDKCIMKCQW